jgi:predicted phosphodiesterase
MDNIMIISDIHIGFNSKSDLIRKLDKVVREACDNIEKIVFLGDLIGSEVPERKRKEKREGDMKKLESIVNRYNRDDIYLVPGNHDQYSVEEDYLYDELGFISNKQIKDIAILDTSYDSRVAGLVSTEFIRSLQSDVNIMLSHHPLFNYNLEDNIWFEEYPEMAYCINKKWIEKDIERINPNLIVNGHLHNRYVKQKEDYTVYSVNPFNRKNRSSEINGFFTIIDRSKDCIKEYKIKDDLTIKKSLQLSY